MTEERQASESKVSEENRPGEQRPQGPPPLPEATFATFVLSLNTSALVHLGEIPDPSTKKVQKDLALAKHAIDTLAMIQEKTKGNLTKEEKALVEHLLFDLRLKFVKASEQ